MHSTLTPEQRGKLDSDGFVLLEDVFTAAEMKDLAAHIERYQRRHEEDIRARGGEEGISRAGEITFTAFLAENDANIRAFATRAEFVAISTQLLGPDTDLYWNQSVFKQPEGEKPFPWHQDEGYTPVEPAPYLTLWLALNDATPENGCVSIIPGSHKLGRVPHESSPIGLVCHPLDHPDQGTLIPVRAGSIAAFWSSTFHKSGVNRSRGVRKAYVIQFSRAGLRNATTGELIPNRIPVARGGRAANSPAEAPAAL